MGGTILAVGAEGKFAGLVVPALAACGAKVCGLVRKAEAADVVRSHGAAEIAIGDLRDPASIQRALEGVVSLLYIAPAFLPDETEVGVRLADAVKQAGVHRFVFSSVIHTVLSALPNHARKASVEEAVLDSGLEHTFLHPALFFQNYAGSWGKVIETGVLAEPWSDDTCFPRVDYRDVAEAAAMALTKDKLLYGTFELCPEGWLDRHEVATLIGDGSGERSRPAGLIRRRWAKRRSRCGTC